MNTGRQTYPATRYARRGCGEQGRAISQAFRLALGCTQATFERFGSRRRRTSNDVSPTALFIRLTDAGLRLHCFSYATDKPFGRIAKLHDFVPGVFVNALIAGRKDGTENSMRNRSGTGWHVFRYVATFALKSLPARIRSATLVRGNHEKQPLTALGHPPRKSGSLRTHLRNLSAGSAGLVTVSDGHRDSEQEIENVRTSVGEFRNVMR